MRNLYVVFLSPSSFPSLGQTVEPCLLCRTFASGSSLQRPLLPGPSHLSPLDLLSRTKEMKTFIRKWVCISHFWQLAGEHLWEALWHFPFVLHPHGWLPQGHACCSAVFLTRSSSRLFVMGPCVTGRCWEQSDSSSLPGKQSQNLVMIAVLTRSLSDCWAQPECVHCFKVIAGACLTQMFFCDLGRSLF